MAIDPRLYEKYSGRSGDPYKRLGEALSRSAAQNQSLSAAKDKTYMQRRMEAKFKLKLAWAAITGGVALVVLLWRAITG